MASLPPGDPRRGVMRDTPDGPAWGGNNSVPGYDPNRKPNMSKYLEMLVGPFISGAIGGFGRGPRDPAAAPPPPGVSPEQQEMAIAIGNMDSGAPPVDPLAPLPPPPGGDPVLDSGPTLDQIAGAQAIGDSAVNPAPEVPVATPPLVPPVPASPAPVADVAPKPVTGPAAVVAPLANRRRRSVQRPLSSVNVAGMSRR